MCSSIFSCCFSGKAYTPPPLPNWTIGFTKEVIAELGGEANIATFPIYEDSSLTINDVHPNLTSSDHNHMNLVLTQNKKKIGVFAVKHISEEKTITKTHIIFLRTHDRFQGKTKNEMYGIYITESKERPAIHFAFRECSTRNIFFKEQTGDNRLEPIQALIRGNSLGPYKEKELYEPELLSNSYSYPSGHGGRIYLGDPDPSHLL